MANIRDLRQLVQLKLQNTNSQYLPHIDSAIEASWGMLAKMTDWWFLDSPEPKEFSIVAGADTFQVKAQGIGQVLHVANESNRQLWVYKARRQYQLYRRGCSDTTTGAVAVFTDYGLKADYRKFMVNPIPSVSATYYLHYKEAGTLANLDKLPSEWNKVLHHLVMSLVAPPLEMRKNFWKALTADEDKMFQYWLGEMLRVESPVADEEMDLELDSLTSERLEEINNL